MTDNRHSSMLNWARAWMGRAVVGGVMLAACTAHVGSGFNQTFVASVFATSRATGAGQGSQTPIASSAAFSRSLVGHTVTGRVTTVVDGDTVEVRLDTGQELRVRLEGIDAPERGQPFFAPARAATRVALFDKAVTLRATDVDRYERLVARVTAGAHDSSLDLIQAGLACHFTRYSSDPALAAAQLDAKSHARGFWAAGGRRPSACSLTVASAAPAAAPTRPVSRSASSTAANLVAEEFHGNRRSKVYHQASCRNYNCPNCVVVFKSHEEARAAGFRPAGDCFR